MLASREPWETSVAITSTHHWSETEGLVDERNYQRFSRVNMELVQREAAGPSPRRVTLDIDSSESPVHCAQEQSAYNGHFESVATIRYSALAYAVLYPTAGRMPFNAEPIWADPRAHRPTRVASELIERMVHGGSEMRSESIPARGSLRWAFEGGAPRSARGPQGGNLERAPFLPPIPCRRNGRLESARLA